MRILALNWQDRRNPLAGGAEVYFFEVFKRLIPKHEVFLFCSSFPGASQRENIDGIEVIRTGTRNTFNFIALKMLPDLVRALGPDLVVDDLNKIPFYSPKRTSVPCVALVMHLFQNAIFQEVAFPFASYVYLGEKLIPWAYRRSWFGVLSESTARDLVKMGLDRKRMEIIPPGVNLDLCQPDLERKKRPLVAHVGRLKRYKSTDHLICACALLRDRKVDFETVIVGDGDDRPRLEALVRRLRLTDRVRFTGYVPETGKVRVYQEAALLVETSAKEGWGMIVIEANACGTPVIAARRPGLVDSVAEGQSGILYQYGNVIELADLVERKLKDTAWLRDVGRSAVTWARRFTWDSAAQRMSLLLSRAL